MGTEYQKSAESAHRYTPIDFAAATKRSRELGDEFCLRQQARFVRVFGTGVGPFLMFLLGLGPSYDEHGRFIFSATDFYKYSGYTELEQTRMRRVLEVLEIVEAERLHDDVWSYVIDLERVLGAIPND
jgi:hypothetical protein